MFVAYLEQSGDGCDYTIACGKKLVELSARNHDDALKELKAMLFGDGRICGGDTTICKITLYWAETVQCLPVQDWYNQEEEKERIARIEQEINKERAEYWRLKEKFSG